MCECVSYPFLERTSWGKMCNGDKDLRFWETVEMTRVVIFLDQDPKPEKFHLTYLFFVDFAGISSVMIFSLLSLT